MAMKYAEAEQAAGYLAVVAQVEAGQARHSGCSVGCLRTVVRVAALRTLGGKVTTADLVGAGFGQAEALRVLIAEAVKSGFLVRVGERGPVELSASGRRLVADCSRAWARAVRSLLAFLPVAPYPGVGRGKERGKSGKGSNAKKKI